MFNVITYKIRYWKRKDRNQQICRFLDSPFLLLLLLDEKFASLHEIIISEIRYESVESCLDGCNELPANWGNEHTYRAFPSRLLIPHCVVRAARDTRGELPPHVHKKVKRPFSLLLLLLFSLSLFDRPSSKQLAFPNFLNSQTSPIFANIAKISCFVKGDNLGI